MKGLALTLVLIFLYATRGESYRNLPDTRPLEHDSVRFVDEQLQAAKSSDIVSKRGLNEDEFPRVEREAEVVVEHVNKSNPGQNRDSLSDSCGIPIGASNKAIGGLLSPEGKYPWVVALIYFDRLNRTTLSCSGVLVSRSIVLTSAECLRRQVGIPDEIRVGTTRLDKGKSGGQAVNTQFGIVHNQFDLQDLRGNIALVVLEEEVELNEFVQPACLATSTNEIPRDDLVTAAWNFRNGYGGSLLTFKSEITHSSKCQYSDRRAFNSKDICVYSKKDQDRVCKTDIGAPMMYDKDGQTYVLGILSHASACDENQDTAAVYTSVPAYASWIKTKMAELKSLQ